ncbi:nitronate monooxygenase [Pseudomonas lalucatii]|uniref:Nitronate monooxygenase n=1 Tax=Pseudomonas lalucatii TaxID=1424203 RepID=A0ABS5Q0C6_9PSED|nr:nitronate monooxygenase [Pseudomonas lalucatii]MBS7662094.1 nitronate monooxygenase [Pseudomonas lalucatii]MBS7690466.1 nitronate monooxygenase [Pseudomonas lalucatii]MBS7726110.1 nitronate monooxygenase [Pseudomonas lalucatii]QVM88320.1 nitronate monooxygenase [Pseudomonas lalucatii]
MTVALNTRLTELLGCRYPIIQTAMGWVADPRLVAATGNAGGFGFLAGATIEPQRMEAAIRETQALSDAPFGVNFHMYQANAGDIVELVLKHRVKAVSYSRSPGKAMIGRLKDAGVVCIPTVGALKHAVKAVEMGADAVTIQGGEGGGHTGSVPTALLLAQVVDAVQVPVVAAGGFKDGRGLVAALALGASGIAMGTRFLMSADSPVPPATLARYLAVRDPAAIIVSRAIDGMPQRMIRNELLDQLERSGGLRRLLLALRCALAYRKHSGASLAQLLASALKMGGAGELSAAQTLMAANAPMVIQKAMVEGLPAQGVLPAGQVAASIDSLPGCAELIGQIVQEAEARLVELCRHIS